MAVHHFIAADVTVARGWQPMHTFPQDGRAYEVRDEANHIGTALWVNGEVRCDGPARVLTHWRNPEE